MTAVSRYVCVDWGISHLRAALCEISDAANVTRDTLSGPGIKDARHTAEEALFEVIAPWTDEYPALPILLAGTVGSNIGWRSTPYLACPFPVEDISVHCSAFTTRGHDIVIVPGAECTNSFGETDTMRSEELQILGWLYADPSRQQGTYLVCLPGTHTKWVLVADGRIVSFQTAVTGELYALMLEHSILLAESGEADSDTVAASDAFALGVATCRKTRGALSHALFSARSRLLTQQLGKDSARSYLSGMLVAADVMGALEMLNPASESVFLIGEPTLCGHFSDALRAFGVESEMTQGSEAAINGFFVVYRNLYQQDQARSALA